MIKIRTITYYNGLNYRVHMEKRNQEGIVTYIFSYPDLPGVQIESDTISHGIETIRLAKEEWIQLAFNEGRDIPLPNSSINE